ncbi:glucose-methanol-choline oxidoreductase-like protein [Cadophora sp. MPI-SDFR-AT-0126]|nr:glucose-methanol-choline oxidoreductase-like protein [Leotiomycetes sp. MPI-SDFR-AT-0126]
MAGEKFDFIIIGGGTSGCALASQLADTPSRPSVLLIESGTTNSSPSLRTPESRWTTCLTEPDLNWNDVINAQPQLHNRILPCFRGKGLGGSSAINFSNWIVGSREDFDDLAERVGDNTWRWDGKGGVKERLRRVERLHLRKDIEVGSVDEFRVLDGLSLKRHSKEGKVDMSFGDPAIPKWAEILFDAAREQGVKINGDINSGDPTGWGLCPSTYHNGSRVTAATAYLSSPPANLTILASTSVSRVLFRSDSGTKRAIGVQTSEGQDFRAAKEVILSAGAINSPKLLLLSGIGPRDLLEDFGIEVVSEVPGVGKNLKDHPMATITLLFKTTSADLVPAERATNPEYDVGTPMPSAYVSPPAILASKEFSNLPTKTQQHLRKVPLAEYGANNLPMTIPPDSVPAEAKIITIFTALQNTQSPSSVKLASSDPAEAPKIDLRILEHEYDRRVAIEGMRSLLKFVKSPALGDKVEKMLEGPKSESDEDILEHWRATAIPFFHFGGTCRMGRDGGDEEVVVDHEFKVRGVEGLRVVDLSVVPVLGCGHTSAMAYLLGELASEKIAREYGL